MSKCILFINGEMSDYDWYKKLINPQDKIICADGGAYHALKMDLLPDLLVGDFDSLNQLIVEKLKEKGTAIVKLFKDKDEVDSEIALEKALEFNPQTILILGAMSSKIDYNLSNIHLLVPLLEKGTQAYIVSKNHLIYLVNSHFPGQVKGQPGDRVSILPMTTLIEKIYLDGFKFPLTGQTISIGMSWGMSNELQACEGTITIEKGTAVVFQEINGRLPIF